MLKTHHISDNAFIAYKEHKSKKNLPTTVFLHGLFSNMEASKASFMHEFCKKNDLPFIRFHALGHGLETEQSSGEFTDQSIDSWFNSAKDLISKLCPNGAILIGSSMGGWVSLLLAIHMKSSIHGLICISAAPDFTEDIYNALPTDKKAAIDNKGIVQFSVGPYTYNISHILVNDSRKHALLHLDNIPITCPVHLLHGMNDMEVSYKKAIKIIEKIESPNTLLTLIKSGTHSLSDEQDLELLANITVRMLNNNSGHIAKTML